MTICPIAKVTINTKNEYLEIYLRYFINIIKNINTKKENSMQTKKIMKSYNLHQKY